LNTALPDPGGEAMRPGPARAATLLAALALASLCFPPRSAAASPYHLMGGQEDTASPLENVTEGNLSMGQSFSPVAPFTLTRVSLYVQDRGTDDDLIVRIVPDAGGEPDVAGILAFGVNNSDPAYGWVDFTLSPTVAVSAGTPYWIVAEGIGGAGNGYAWRYTSADLYARGRAATASGGSWTIQPGDFSFRLWGWTPAAVTARVTLDRAQVASGDSVRYAISLINAGTEDATDVWVNATLDSLLALANASGPGPVFVTGPSVGFRATTVPQGTTWFFLTATTRTLLDDGASIDLPITADFSDAAGRRSVAMSAPVEVLAPNVLVTLECAESLVDPGDVLTFEVNVTNEGRTAARHVWLNETLPAALAYVSDTAPVSPTRTGGAQSWHLLDVAPGTTRFNVTVQVDPRARETSVVAHEVSVDFTDRAGDGLVRGRSNAVSLTVAGAAAAGSPWLWGSFGISATLVAGTYVGIARRRLRTEEIFLIHRSGVLLVHMSKAANDGADPDVLSGMLTAIMDFVRDSFNYEEDQELQGLDLGRFRVHVRLGRIAYLAVVHSGKETRWLGKVSARAVAEIEAEHGDLLRDWNGDVRALDGVRDLLRGHILSPTGPSRSRRWLRELRARVDQSFKPMRPL